MIRPAMLLVLIILTACGSGDVRSDSEAEAYSGRLIAFGDSNTRQPNVSNNFVNVIGKHLHRQVINLAEDGTVIQRHLERVQEFEFHEGDIVIFMSGYNDMRYFGAAGLNDYKVRLASLVQILNSKGIGTYLGSTLRMTAEGYAYDLSTGLVHDNTTADAYRDAVLDIQSPVHVVNLTDNVPAILSNFFDDYRHINESGHAAVAAAFGL